MGVNWQDYGARMYMADLGRFGTIDPHADSYHGLTPYHYVGNNPLNFIDPTGMDSVSVQNLDMNEFDTNDDTVILDEVVVTSEGGGEGEGSLWDQLMALVGQDIMTFTDGPGGPDTALRESDGSQARVLNIDEVLPAGTTRNSKRTTDNTKMKNFYEGKKSFWDAAKELFGKGSKAKATNEPDSIFGGEGLSPSGYGRFIILPGQDSTIIIYGKDSVKTKSRKTGI